MKLAWGLGDDLGEGGFAGAGRAPKDHGADTGLIERVALNLDAEGLAGAEEMVLAAVFGEGAGAHSFG